MDKSSSQIPGGYKQTELGLIPEDWEVKQLKNLVSTIIDNRGKTPPYSNNPDIELIETASISFVSQYPNYSKVTKFVSSETYKNWFRGHPKKNDLLVSTVGEYSGSSAIMENNRGTVAQNLIALRIKDINPMYVFYWSRSKIFRTQLNQVMMSQAQPSLRVPWLLNFYVNFPKPSEQTSIATVLSDTDALIEHLEKLIDKKKVVKQGAMQQLLTGKKRLPKFSGEWVTNNLKDMCWYQEGPGVRNYQFTASGVKLLNGTNISKGKVVLDTTNRFISEKEAYGWYKHFLVNRGDILIASSGVTIDKFQEKVAFASSTDLPLCMNTSTIRFKVNPGLLDKFLYFFLQSDSFKNQIGKQATGSAQLNFGPSHLNKINIDVPPTKDEQIEIAKILSDVDSEIESLEKKRDKYVMIKQGMMQQLLTGKIRIYANN